jgi:hypothetical protein
MSELIKALQAISALADCVVIRGPNESDAAHAFDLGAQKAFEQAAEIANAALVVPRGTSEYVNTPAKSATERALHIAVKALEKLARELEPGPYDVAEQAEFATDELARIRTLVPTAGED